MHDIKDFENFLLEKIDNPGVDNESLFINEINSYLKKHKSIKIIISSDKKTYTYNSVIGIINTARDTKNRKKADVQLVTLDQSNKQINIPISIKTNNSDYWESAESYYGSKARTIIDDLVKEEKVKLTRKRLGYYEIDPQIAIRASVDEAIDVMFGSDILPNGFIIKNTFTSNDFSFDDKTLTIKVSKIIDDPKDVEDTDDEVWFFFRRDPGRNVTSLGYKGIRILAACKRRINSDNILKIKA